MEAVWHYSSDDVGLVYLAGFLPALICQYTPRDFAALLTRLYSDPCRWMAFRPYWK